jgi:hypothetical protein
MLNEDQRSAILDGELVKVAYDGGHLVSRTPTQAVVEYGRQPNHILHLLLSVFS